MKLLSNHTTNTDSSGECRIREPRTVVVTGPLGGGTLKFYLRAIGEDTGALIHTITADSESFAFEVHVTNAAADLFCSLDGSSGANVTVEVLEPN